MTASCLSVLVRLLLTTVLLPTRRLHTEVLSSTCTVVQNVVLIVPYIRTVQNTYFDLSTWHGTKWFDLSLFFIANYSLSLEGLNLHNLWQRKMQQQKHSIDGC